jgi:hypothetical protein
MFPMDYVLIDETPLSIDCFKGLKKGVAGVITLPSKLENPCKV